MIDDNVYDGEIDDDDKLENIISVIEKGGIVCGEVLEKK